MKNNKKYRVLILFLSIIIFAELWVFLLISKSDLPQDIPNEESEYIEESSVNETKSEEPSSKVIYERPEYDFKRDEIEIEISGLTKSYRIAWVSDIHMITDHKASIDVKEEFLEDIEGRYQFFKTEDNDYYSDELWPEIVRYLNYEHLDGIIFGGDLLDYCSESNMDKLRKEYDKLDPDLKKMYIRADHDYGFWYGGDDFKETDAENFHAQLADRDSLNYKYLDFEEFIVLGINRSTKDMTVHQYEIVKEMYDKAKASGKGVIIATHVPYASMVDDMNEISLEQKSMEVRNKPYYWGGGSYIPNDVTQQYLDLIYSNDTSVCAVLAGHLHASWDGMLTKNVRQHIFEPAYRGYIGIINIIPKEE